MLLLSLVMLGLSAPTFAVPGDLDPTFNSDGFDLLDFAGDHDAARAVVMQPDGKIVVAGSARIAGHDDFALIRYNPDGNLDPSFGGGDGIVTTAFVDGNENFNGGIKSLVLQPDGKLVAAGFTDLFGTVDIALVRYNVDGTIDRTFGRDGLGCFSFTDDDACFLLGRDEPFALVRQPDGRLVVAGFTEALGTRDIVILQFLENGFVDRQFGFGFVPNGSSVVRSLSGTALEARALLRQPNDGRLVAAGFTIESGNEDFVLFRLNPNGDSFDTSFFNTGGKRISFGTNRQDRANALVLQPDGKLVATGSSIDGVESSFALVRLNPNGVFDAGFGFGGGVLTSFGPGSFNLASSLVLQPDGKLVEAGTALVPSGEIDFALVRHNSDGSLDPGFGFGGGTLTLLNQGGDDLVLALAAQPNDGKLVAAGTSGSILDPPSLNFAVARYEVGPFGRLSTRSEVQTSRALTPGSMSCKGQPVTILGTPGNDMLRGTIGDDVIHGMGGNDQIFGFDGNDIICGGTGKDRLVAGIGDDLLLGQGGNDRLFGQAGRDTMDGGAGRDSCKPGPGGRRKLKGCERAGGRAPADPPAPPRRRFQLNTFAGGATASPPSIRSSAGTGGWELRGLSNLA